MKKHRAIIIMISLTIMFTGCVEMTRDCENNVRYQYYKGMNYRITYYWNTTDCYKNMARYNLTEDEIQQNTTISNEQLSTPNCHITNSNIYLGYTLYDVNTSMKMGGINIELDIDNNITSTFILDRIGAYDIKINEENNILVQEAKEHDREILDDVITNVNQWLQERLYMEATNESYEYMERWTEINL